MRAVLCIQGFVHQRYFHFLPTVNLLVTADTPNSGPMIVPMRSRDALLP
jgi:hypothetical protein